MKKVITALVILVMLISCNDKPKESEELNDFMGAGEIVKIRGCEYIKSHVYLGRVYTHCGDCNNPIHKK